MGTPPLQGDFRVERRTNPPVGLLRAAHHPFDELLFCGT